jgi:hypothetical protein
MAPCGLRWLLGIDCPGCGMQRAFVALLRGDLISSFRYNAATLPFLITFLYTILHAAIGFRHGARNIIWLFSFTAAVMLLNYVIKLFFLRS